MHNLIARKSRSGAETVCVLVGLLLVTASLLKLRSLAIAIVEPGQDSLTQARTALTGLRIVLEFATGAILVLTTVSRRFLDVCVVLFLVFTCYNAWISLQGRSVCDCFGVVPSTPRASLIVDIACVVLLLIARRSMPQVPLLAFVREASFRHSVTLSLVCVPCCLVALMFCENSAAVARLRGQPLRVAPHELTVIDRGSGDFEPTTIWITNCTNKSIRILGGTSKCNCSVVRDLPLKLEPRETRAIQGVFRPPLGTGRFEMLFVLYHDVERTAPIEGQVVVRVN